MTEFEGLKTKLEGIRVEDSPHILKQKSRDFFWYSPFLKRHLDNVEADFVVTPSSEEEVIRTLQVCFASDIPVTARGAGTGNRGQSMPLAGGVVLDLSEMNSIREIRQGSVVAEAGAVMADIDAATRAHSGQELRMHPSSYRTATIGGFLAGGSGGIGSINWGGLRDLGNVLNLRVVTMEADPQVLEVTGDNLQRVLHAYGTNGIITEAELPLTISYDWVDMLIGFDDFMDAVRFSDELAASDGLLFKNIAPIAAPVPYEYFSRYRQFFGKEQSVAVLMVAPCAIAALEAFLLRQSKGEVLYRSDAVERNDFDGLPPAYELCWNHTTLRGLRVDPTLTYLKVRYPFPEPVNTAGKLLRLLDGELLGHLEFVRHDGKMSCLGLPIVRYSSEDRLNDIIRLHEDHGCQVLNPHRYTLEESGLKQPDEVQLAFKKRADPKGLLNPGKMIAWHDPDHDFSAGKAFLFPGLKRALSKVAHP